MSSKNSTDSNSLDIVYKSPEELITYAFNNKDHPQEQIDILCNIIQRFWFNSPIILDKNNVIIAGHGRIYAAKKLWLPYVPCIIKNNLSDKEVREYRLLDNRIAELATNNLQNIQIELEAIQSDFLNDLYSDIVLVQTDDALDRELHEDDVPLPKKKCYVKHGDIYQLGRHILMCWDSTNYEEIEKLLSGQKAALLFTDPPYNVNYKGTGQNTSNHILNDQMSSTSFLAFLLAVFKNCHQRTSDTCPFYVFHSASTQIQFETALKENGFEIKNQMVWNKPSAALGWWDYRWKHEPFFYGGKKWEKTVFYGDRTHSTVWDFDMSKSDETLLKRIKHAREAEKQGKTTVWSMRRDNVAEYVHPTQKPVELIGYALENSSKIGDLILDPFGWSGSTLIAAEKHQRRCCMMELDAQYVQVIIQRFYEYTKWVENITCLNRSVDIVKMVS